MSLLVAITTAYDMAARAHARQRRKGPDAEPYMNHLCEVAALVAEALGDDDPEAVVAAVLHDAVEDTDVSEAGLRHVFGDRVADIVMAVTDDPAWEALNMPERKARQAAKMRGASSAAKAVKIADQTSNLRSIPSAGAAWSAERNCAYLAAARGVVDACRGPHPGLEEHFDGAATGLEVWIEREGAR